TPLHALGSAGYLAPTALRFDLRGRPWRQYASVVIQRTGLPRLRIITMKRQILIFWCAIVSAFPSLQLPILAQSQPSNVPSAIFGDPLRDAANPTRNEAVW